MSHKNRIIKKILKTLLNVCIPLILPVVIISVWQICSNAQLIDTRLFPSPSRIWDEFLKMYHNGTLVNHLLVSGNRVVIGFAIGGALGLVVGTLTGLFSWLNKSLSAIVGALRPIPMVAWIPLLILWLGIDEAPKITVIAVGSFWPILVNTSQGIKNVDSKYLEVGKILEKNKFQILSKIIFPASLPSVFTGIRLGISSAWNCVVTAEMIAASAGIGFMIMQGRQYYNVSQVLVGVAIIGVIGLILDEVLIFLENIVLRWNTDERN